MLNFVQHTTKRDDAANQTERRGGELAWRSYHECFMAWQQHQMFQHNDAEASRKGVGQHHCRKQY